MSERTFGQGRNFAAGAAWAVGIEPPGVGRPARRAGGVIGHEVFDADLLGSAAFFYQLSVGLVEVNTCRIAWQRGPLGVVLVKAAGNIGFGRRLLSPETLCAGSQESRSRRTDRRRAIGVGKYQLATDTRELVLLEVAQPTRISRCVRAEHAQENLVFKSALGSDTNWQACCCEHTVDRLNFVQDLVQCVGQFTCAAGAEIFAAAEFGHGCQ